MFPTYNENMRFRKTSYNKRFALINSALRKEGQKYHELKPTIDCVIRPVSQHNKENSLPLRHMSIILVMSSLNVINIMTKSNLGNRGFNFSYNFRSITEGSQGGNAR